MKLREPLLLPFLCFALGLVLERQSPLGPAVWAALGLAALAFIPGRTRLPALCLSLVFVGSAFWQWRLPKKLPELDAEQNELVTLSGCVVEPPRLHPDREQFVLELAPDARARVSLFVKPGDAPPALEYGQLAEVQGRVRRPRNYQNEGAFDVESYLKRQRIYWSVAGRTVETLPGECGSKVLASIYRLRGRLLDRIDQLFGEDRGKIAALLIGESAQLDRDWSDSFRRTGTYHALVVSGTHVTALAAVVIFLLKLVLPEFPALMVTAGLSWVYAIIAGANAPVLRAAAGFTLVLLCRFLYRRARMLNILACVAWGFVLYDPQQLFDASFQLSFLSLAAICAIALPLNERFMAPWQQAGKHLTDPTRDPRLDPQISRLRVELRLMAETVSLCLRWPVRPVTIALSGLVRLGSALGTMMLISASVQLALAIPFVVYFHRWAFTAVLANVGVVFLLEMAIPIGFAATLSGLPPLVWLTRAMVDGASSLAQWHLRWEPDFRIPAPPLWLALLVVATLLTFALLLRRQSRWTFAGALASIGALAVLLIHPFPVDAQAGELEITALDVGQGDALLAVFPDGTRMMVDAGGLPTFGRASKPMDLGEEVVAPYLWSRSMRSVDIVALTHAHADHMGGMQALIENFHPRELWITGLGRSAELDRLLAAARARGVTVRQCRAGAHWNFGAATVSALAPAAEDDYDGPPRNEHSLVLEVRLGQHRFLLPGDATTMAPPEGPFTVLKLPHHGGKARATPALVAEGRPLLGLISVGDANRYGHPHAQTLDALAEAHTLPLRTDQQGRLSIHSDGHRLRWETFAGERQLSHALPWLITSGEWFSAERLALH
ncbi:MAG: ComEC/Rec2 family competence protein [Acidobacteria bacterium]|nr:ComEC/Rec2 family competence protein [Acidobacteriota bacterium]